MLDTLAIARTLTDAGADPKLADAITAAVHQAAEHGDHATRADLETQTARFDARLAGLEARIYRAMLLQAGAIVGAVVAILRLLG